MASGNLSEVFTSIEGEGVYAGQPVTFVRLSGCNLSCCYCDTPQARQDREQCEVGPGGGGGARRVANPVPAGDLALLVRGLAPAPVIVFTGGEPLLQAPFVAEAGARLRRLGLRIHLETNGTLPEALLAVKPVVDFISMDVKLPWSQGGKEIFDLHRAFLEALGGKPAAVKVVVAEGTDAAEVEAAAKLVASVNRDLPFVLQPAFEGTRPAVAGGRLLDLLGVAHRRLPGARVSVQMHKVLGIQ